ncbi:putative glycerol-3-phosphate acyltransferase PlsY [Hydrogenophaga sp. T4]|nr:putative glycerol-3-phosphate acyltransferase PlsY [Hydrogenophaga sp. T4]
MIVAFFFRYSSLASIVTAVFAPAYYLFGRQVAWDAPNVMVLSLAVMGILLVWRHAENINRLFAGKESKLGSKSQ